MANSVFSKRRNDQLPSSDTEPKVDNFAVAHLIEHLFIDYLGNSLSEAKALLGCTTAIGEL